MNEPLYQYNTKIYRIANAQALISGSFIATSGLGGVKLRATERNDGQSERTARAYYFLCKDNLRIIHTNQRTTLKI